MSFDVNACGANGVLWLVLAEELASHRQVTALSQSRRVEAMT